jgi:hypothetical protein
LRSGNVALPATARCRGTPPAERGVEIGAGTVGEHADVRNLCAALFEQWHHVRQRFEVGRVGGRGSGQRLHHGDVTVPAEDRQPAPAGLGGMVLDGFLDGVESRDVGTLIGQPFSQAAPAQGDLVAGVLAGAGGVEVDRHPRARTVEQRPHEIDLAEAVMTNPQQPEIRRSKESQATKQRTGDPDRRAGWQLGLCRQRPTG